MANANLALEIKKPVPELGSANNLEFAKNLGYTVFLVLANLTQEFAQGFASPNSLLLSTQSTILFSPIDLGAFAKSFLSLVLSIKVSGTAIWLKPWINC